jgi:hypothetical protein
MLGVHYLQLFYGLSDPGMEGALRSRKVTASSGGAEGIDSGEGASASSRSSGVGHR